MQDEKGWHWYPLQRKTESKSQSKHAKPKRSMSRTHYLGRGLKRSDSDISTKASEIRNSTQKTQLEKNRLATGEQSVDCSNTLISPQFDCFLPSAPLSFDWTFHVKVTRSNSESQTFEMPGFSGGYRLDHLEFHCSMKLVFMTNREGYWSFGAKE
ncbi:hypothetical protein STEG23_024897 [Scotinomys teguina]